MVVCMSRRICVDFYKAIIALRPTWHNADDKEGAIKVVMTGSAADPRDCSSTFGPRTRVRTRQAIQGSGRSAKIVIVRDMWLTGFDAPCMHTMYLDKPMQGHDLMQAIARVNRVFRDKPGGLVVDYLGLADQLKRALQTYSASHGRGNKA